MRIGKITVGALDEWSLNAGSVTSWHPTAAAQETARRAPVSSVPVSYMQHQHLRNYCERTAEGLNFSRQIIASCEMAGQCDISAMDHAVNAYLRRHDTFRSWFEQSGDGQFIRHAIDDPAEIEFKFDEASSFQDLESGEQIPVVPSGMADEYRKLVQEHIAALSSRFSQNRVDYALVNTAEPLDRALFSYLSSRERLSRVR